VEETWGSPSRIETGNLWGKEPRIVIGGVAKVAFKEYTASVNGCYEVAKKSLLIINQEDGKSVWSRKHDFVVERVFNLDETKKFYYVKV
jgi:hypothetical protein